MASRHDWIGTIPAVQADPVEIEIPRANLAEVRGRFSDQEIQY